MAIKELHDLCNYETEKCKLFNITRNSFHVIKVRNYIGSH